MIQQEIMTVASLKKLLEEYGNEITEDFQVWLSSDEEGNVFLPMPSNPRLCLAMDPAHQRIVLFPSHGSVV